MKKQLANLITSSWQTACRGNFSGTHPGRPAALWKNPPIVTIGGIPRGGVAVMGQFDFLQDQPQGPRPAPRPTMPAPYPSQTQSPAPSAAPRFRHDASKEQYLRMVITLCRIAAVLYLLAGVLGAVGLVLGLVQNAEILVISGAVTAVACLIGAIGCMAAAELIQLAIRATLAVEETAFTLRFMRRG